MRSASNALITLLNTSTQFCIADLLTIVPVSGSIIRLTSADKDVAAVSKVDNASHVFSSSGPPFKRGRTKLKVGLEVDTLQLTLYPDVIAHQLNGMPWPAAANSGYFDEAQLILERVFMPTWFDTSAGTVILFSGRVGQAEGLREEIQIEVRSDLELLVETLFPRNVFQGGCMHTLFDSGCGLSKAAYTTAGTAAAASSATIINATLAQATGYFDLGIISFTSGANAGLSRSIRAYVSGSPGTIALMRPLPVAPANGDAFTITPGCDKVIAPSIPSIHAGDIRYGTCATKFNNIANARAMPFIPTPENAT